MRNRGEGSGSNLSQTQSHPLSESGCFLSNRSQYRLNIARMLNKDQKKKLLRKLEGLCLSLMRLMEKIENGLDGLGRQDDSGAVSKDQAISV